MGQNIIEHLRQKSIERLFQMNGFESCYEIWKDEINSLTTAKTSSQVINLGNHLSDIFRLTRTEGRTQSDVSGGGAAWEALVCWYLNICSIGRRTVVIKHNKELIPSAIADAMTVNYNNFVSNTEADLVAITFPDKIEYNSEISDIEILDLNGVAISTHTTQGNVNIKQILNSLCHRDFNNLEIHIIQCKTNWNDNAQIPMLWDMIYSANDFRAGITVGKNGYDIHRTQRFSYSFVTVPTTDLSKIKETSVCVNRVRHISGGNYWGHSSRNGIANSIKEMLNRNLSSGDRNNHYTTLSSELANLETDYTYFRL